MEIQGFALTPEQEAALLLTIPPRLLLDALRGYDGAVERVFAGFRPSIESMKLPPVRQRLHYELEGDTDLQGKVWEAWQQGHADLLAAIHQAKTSDLPAVLPDLVQRWGTERVELALRTDTRKSVHGLAAPPAAEPQTEAPAPAVVPSPEPAGEVARLRQQVRLLRAEAAESRREAAKAEGRLGEAKKAAERWKTAAEERAHEASDLRRSAEKHAHQVERLQKAKSEAEDVSREAGRGQRRLQAELDALRRQVDAQARARALAKATMPDRDAWLQAVRDMVRQGQAQAAVPILAHLVKRYPEAAPLRTVLADAYAAIGAAPAAVTEWCWLARRHLGRGETTEAIRAAHRALAARPEDRAARAVLQEILAGTTAEDTESWTAAAKALVGLEKAHPAACRAVVDVLAPASRRALEIAQGRRAHIGMDIPIEWPAPDGAVTASVRAVVDAIDAGRSELVDRVRRALPLLKTRSPQTHAAVTEALRSCGAGYLEVLSRRARAVVVDGSNVAWYGCEETGRPRLEHLLTLRRELHVLGYFPLLLYIDAALLHQIDRREELERLIARGEVLVADPGTDADDRILREAQDLRCPVVTNDRMLEHDPEGRVPKLRFDLDVAGAAIHDPR